MKTIPLSVVTVCRNAETTIQKTFDSVLAQTVMPAEYFIIDACSTDKTLELANNFKRKASFPVTIIHERDRGISDAFNKGVRLSSQEWVHILSADDFYWNANALSAFEKTPKTKGINVIVGRASVENSLGGFYLENRFAKDRSNVLTARIPHPSCIIRKSAYDIAGNYNIALKTAMDYELLLRYEKIFGIETFAFFDEVFVGIGYGGESIVNASRGYRELAGSKILHTNRPLWKTAADYYFQKIFFTTTFGKILWKISKNIRSSF